MQCKLRTCASPGNLPRDLARWPGWGSLARDVVGKEVEAIKEFPHALTRSIPHASM